MKICYVDEAGCTGWLPAAVTDIQPVLVFAAVFFDYSRLHQITESYLRLKQRFFPGSFPAEGNRFLSGILSEIKGSDLRNAISNGHRNTRRHRLGFLDGVIKIIEENEIQLMGRVWVKGISVPINGRSVYTFSIQAIYQVFQHYLTRQNDFGSVVLDSRWLSANRQVAHSIFTQKFRLAGDMYDRIVDLPAFAHSDNHAGLQIADLIASAYLFPMSTYTYSRGHVTGVHVQPGFERIKRRYRLPLRDAQYRFQEASGRWRGGITVADMLEHRSGGLLFQ